VKAGSFLNILGVAIVTLFINTYGMVYFGLDEFPDWAKPVNTTASWALEVVSLLFHLPVKDFDTLIFEF